MDHAATSLRYALCVGFILITGCTTGTDVVAGSAEQEKLDRIAAITHRLIEDARKNPQKPASELVKDFDLILLEAEGAEE